MKAVQMVGYEQAGYTDVPEPNPISNELLVKEDCMPKYGAHTFLWIDE